MIYPAGSDFCCAFRHSLFRHSDRGSAQTAGIIVGKFLTYVLGMLLFILSPSTFAANYSQDFSSGVASGWTAVSGTWGVGSGSYRSTAIGPEDITVYGGDTWGTDFTYHLDIYNSYNNYGNLAGAVYNYQNSTNYYEVKFAALNGGVTIVKVINGVATTVATGSYGGTVGYGFWFGVDIIRSGTTTSVKFNGTNIFNNITQSELGVGKIGLVTTWCDASFDNISVTISSGGATRDPLTWPFADTSIWNLPISTSAVYVSANLDTQHYVMTASPSNDWVPMPQIDWDVIVLTPNAPLTTINYSSARWTTGADRCTATGGQILQVPMPSNFVVPNSTLNNAAAFLLAGGLTINQTQPFTRCFAGQSGTSNTSSVVVDIKTDGTLGSHGGSGLSSIGGTLRIGELRPGSQGPKHALKIAVNSARVLHQCASASDCFRWPANTADAGASSSYGWGANPINANNSGMKMGALLAIPASVNLSTLGLTTDPGKQLAWTLQNYGGYIVDSTPDDEFVLAAEQGPAPDGSWRSLAAQFLADYPTLQGIEERQGPQATPTGPFAQDMRIVFGALYLVDNNALLTPGGGAIGSARLQPLAPPFQ